MTFKVFFRPLAEVDLDQIDDFIAEDSPPRALDAAIARGLAEMPERGPRREDLL